MHKMNGSAELVGTVRSGFHSSMRGRAEIDGNENFGWNGTENITFRSSPLNHSNGQDVFVSDTQHTVLGFSRSGGDRSQS